MSNIVYPRYKAWQANGTSPAAGYYLYTYASGTTIPKATYSNATLTSLNANPIILDSNGEAVIFSGGSGDYRFDLKTSGGALINTFDPVANILGGLLGSPTGFVENIADLRALAVTSVALVDVLGYYAGGDNGGGSFKFDPTSAAADNIGTVIQPNTLPATGRWIRLWTAPVSVKWFGWTGAGGAADTAGLAAFVAYTAALTLGGEFYVPGQITLHHLDTNKANLKFISESLDTLKAGIEWAKSASINTPTAKIWNKPDFELNFLSNTGTIDFYIGTYVAGSKVLSLSETHVTLPATQALLVTDLAGAGTRFATLLATGELAAGAAVSSFIDGSGTATYLPIFVDANTITDSLLHYTFPYFLTAQGIKVDKDIVSNFAGVGTLPSLSAISATPMLGLKTTSAAADAGDHRFTVQATGVLEFSNMNDAGSSAYVWLKLDRSGITPTLLTLDVPTRNITIGTIGVPSVQVYSSLPVFSLSNSAAGANAKDHRMVQRATGNLEFGLVNDALNTETIWLTLTRTGTTPTLLTIVPPTKYTAIGTQLIPTLQVGSTSAIFGIRANTAAANEHDYTFWADTGFLQFSTVNDAGTAVAWLKATRAANAISDLVITTTTNSLTGKTGIGNGGTPADWLEISADSLVQQIMTSYTAVFGGINLQMRQARGTKASPANLQNGDYMFEIEAFGYNGGWYETVEIKAVVDGVPSGVQSPPSRLEFYTNVLGASPTLQLIIDRNGTVITKATSATASGFQLPHGVAPSAPVNGDLWTTSAGGLFGRINGVTQNYAPLASPTFTGTVLAAAITMSGILTLTAGAAFIGTNSTVGFDGDEIVLSACDAYDPTRGAYLKLRGFNNGFTGTAQLAAASGGSLELKINTTTVLLIESTGLSIFNNTTDSTSLATGSVRFLGGISAAKRITLDGSTGKTIRYANATANAAVAVTFGGVGPTGSTAGNQVGWMRVDINGTDRYVPFW